MRGSRAGFVVFLGIAVGNVGNYLFHLIAARSLGPESYADLAALVALSGIVALPLAHSAEHAVGARIRRALLLAGVVGVVATAALIALSTLAQHVLDIESLGAVVLTAALTAPAFLAPIAWGWAQGLQRFVVLSVSIALGPTIRVALVAVLLAIGLGVIGAMTASLIAAVVAFVAPLWLLRRPLLRPGTAPPLQLRRLTSRVLPVVVGLLAITGLTTMDVVVAKSALSEHEAGIYGAGSLIGRVILYLPAAIATVLLPKVAARVTQRQQADDILAASLAVTAAFCALATLVYTLFPGVVVGVAFGSSFDDAAPLLWRFGLAMSGYSLLNVLLFYHLGRGDRRFSLLLIAGAVVEAVGFGFFHSSARELIAVSAATAALLLIAHDLLMGRELTRMVATLPRLLRRRADATS